MPVHFVKEARRRGIRPGLQNRKFCLNVGGRAGEGGVRGAAEGFGKERRAHPPLGILRNARGGARPVRNEATGRRDCPTPLRRAAGNARPAARKVQATATPATRICNVVSSESFCKTSLARALFRPDSGQLSKICCSELAKAGRGRPRRAVAFDLLRSIAPAAGRR